MIRKKQISDLAALGAVEFSVRSTPRGLIRTGASIREHLSNAVDRGVARCLLTPRDLAGTRNVEVNLRELGEAWQELVVQQIQSYPRSKGVSVGVELVGPAGKPTLAPLQAMEVARTLASSQGVGTVFFSDRKLPKDGPWHWPLRIGFLDDPRSMALCGETAGSYNHKDLIEIRQVRPWPGECDLILLPRLPGEGEFGSLEATVAGMLLIMLEPSEPLPALEQLLDLRERVPRSAIASLRAAQGSHHGFSILVDELSHDRRLDEALEMAAGGPDDFLLIAQPQWLADASITGFLDQVDQAAKDFEGLGELSAELLRYSMPMLSDLRGKIASLGFFSEEGGAKEVAIRMGQIRRQPLAPPKPAPSFPKKKIGTPKMAPPPPAEPAPPMTPPPAMASVSADIDAPPERTAAESRRLQSKVFEIDGAKRIERRHSFRAGRPHEIRILIGPPDESWIQSTGAFPYKKLPPGPKHQLEVILIPSWPEAEAQRSDLTLRPQGPSTEASFDLDIPPELKELEILIHILHKGRHIQTGRLRGKVTGAEDGSDPEMRIELPLSPETQADLGHQRGADLTLICESDTIRLRMPGCEIVTCRLPNLQDWIREVQGILFRAAKNTAWLDSGLGEGAGLDLICALAIQGSDLKRRLLDSITPPPAITRVEVLSECSSESVPIEFLYDFEPPDDNANLCERFLDPGNSIPCPDCAFKADPTRVCPFGFWGLNREIGRQIVKIQGVDPGLSTAPESSREQPSLPSLRSVQMAASAKVDQADPGLISKTFESVKAQVKGSAWLVKTWAEWKQGISERSPSILLLLPHNEKSDKGPLLEIGDKNFIRMGKILRDCIASPANQRVPIILLLGCDTAAAEIGFQDMIRQFRDNGAGMVVGASTKVLGRQAAPAAQEFIRQICGSSHGGVAFAEMMRRARMNLLREGNVLSLALVAYGDADWLVA